MTDCGYTTCCTIAAGQHTFVYERDTAARSTATLDPFDKIQTSFVLQDSAVRQADLHRVVYVRHNCRHHPVNRIMKIVCASFYMYLGTCMAG